MFSGGGEQDELQSDFDIFGKPPPEVLNFVHNNDVFELWPENADPINLFVRLQTQWRYGPIGAVGLDYNGVHSALRFMRIRPTTELFDQIQLMERAALDALAKVK